MKHYYFEITVEDMISHSHGSYLSKGIIIARSLPDAVVGLETHYNEPDEAEVISIEKLYEIDTWEEKGYVVIPDISL